MNHLKLYGFIFFHHHFISFRHVIVCDSRPLQYQRTHTHIHTPTHQQHRENEYTVSFFWFINLVNIIIFTVIITDITFIGNLWKRKKWMQKAIVINIQYSISYWKERNGNNERIFVLFLFLDHSPKPPISLSLLVLSS